MHGIITNSTYDGLCYQVSMVKELIGKSVDSIHFDEAWYGYALHGAKSYLLQDKHGQISDTKSIAPGLDYPGVGPEHSYYKDTGRATYVAVTDKEVLEGFQLLSTTEGIIPALESVHAIYYAAKIAAELGKDKLLVVNISGRGDKDITIAAEALGVSL